MLYDNGFFAMLITNAFGIIFVIQDDQGFWNSMFRDYGLKGTWQLFTLNLQSPDGLKLTWLNGELLFFVTFAILNIFFAYQIFNRTKQAFEKDTAPIKKSC